ncbi:MAG: DUF3143 domain-containing protein [Cyanobacteriota bacterium]|nr:DUF3143 domain-containing protein [Cyanobacteriota bacterium]
MSMPSEETPLYSHPLPALEEWLRGLGARQEEPYSSRWELRREAWTARIELAVEEVKVSWREPGGESVRLFPYGLSRADAEAAILAGP